MRTLVGMNIERNQEGKIVYSNRSRFVISPEVEDMTAGIRDFVADPDHHLILGAMTSNRFVGARHRLKQKALGPGATGQMREYVQLAVDTRSAEPVDIHGASGRVFEEATLSYTDNAAGAKALVHPFYGAEKLDVFDIRDHVVNAVRKGQLGEKVFEGVVDSIKGQVDEAHSYMVRFITAGIQGALDQFGQPLRELSEQELRDLWKQLFNEHACFVAHQYLFPFRNNVEFTGIYCNKL